MRYKGKDIDLEILVRKDMESRNHDLGYEAFRFRGVTPKREYYHDFWGIDFEFTEEPGGKIRKVRYGGYPFTDREELLRDYMRECFREECEKIGKNASVGKRDPDWRNVLRWIVEGKLP